MGGRVLAPDAFGVMGIVNVTPDSFFDGGVHATVETACAHAGALLRDGADVIDIGGESTRPGAEDVPPELEMERIMPVLASLRDRLPDAAISVDTRNARTAAAALEAGAVIVNDVSACRRDPELLDVLAQYGPGYVLMHDGGGPGDTGERGECRNVRGEVLRFFSRELDRLVAAGLPEDRIVLDPGIGFGKTLADNLALLAHPEDWFGFGRPILAGISMKSMFGDLLGLPVEERGAATRTAAALLWERGVFWHRVHDVAATRQGLLLARAVGEGRAHGGA
ncbi:MAG: dihydropteroate synthase [Desulfovibrio sp.]|jgi:dihydropteroate synthase|nr:dihydropteroate synthase [Desulfovibrio sp.]